MFFVIFLILLGVVLKSNHLLNSLISLEFLGLLVFFSLSFIFLKAALSWQMLIALMAAMGCESALGLILFVILTRFYSKDYFLSGSLYSF